MTAPLVGLIPAAGLGIRARPYTREIHKGLFSINGMPNMERIIGIMRDQMGIREIYIVIGYLGDSIREHFSDGQHLGVALNYIENTELDKGWAWSVLLARPYIESHFCVMLCDECYISSNHAALKSTQYLASLAVCAGMPVDDVELIKKNYAISHSDNRVVELIEKPRTVSNDLMGSGSFLFSPDLFALLEQAFAVPGASVDLISMLNQAISDGARVEFFEISGTYVNINDRDSLNLAKYHDRMTHFSDYRLSLLVCSEGDEENISFTLNRYRELGLFHEVVVVLPRVNSLNEALLSRQAEIVVCPDSDMDFGERVRYGLAQLQGDILVMTEADYSFACRDVEKLLGYLKEADMVVGTRTTRQLIEQGSTMTGLVRTAHSGLGKLLELLWWNREGRFTDVGCTLRAFWRSTYRDMESSLRATGPEVLAEMVIEAMASRQRVLEIPVNYFNRSYSLNRHHRNYHTFFRLLWFILRRRLRGPSRAASD